ncbi:WD repeat-containing protein YMR102C [Cornus florida]|uniref:WD repeat-containing protein YMR102C n=1 Tax=Cornus florida TaxID=4283 RepID=UPI0028A10E11|nr:WD repeat-containing protein YMR102C [Cornus florida]
MMGSLSDDEEYQFFDAHDDIATVHECPESSDSSCESDNSASNSFGYDMWTGSPQSVQERRSNFLNWMGQNSDWIGAVNSTEMGGDLLKGEIDRITKRSGSLLRTPSFEDEFSSSRSSVSSWSKDVFELSEESGSNMCRIGNSDGLAGRDVDKLGQDYKQHKLSVMGSEQLVPAEEFDNTSGSSASAKQLTQREAEVDCNSSGMMNRGKNRWLSRLRFMTCIMNGQGKANNLRLNASDPIRGARVQRVRVHHYRKRSKELSALFMGQEIQAHKGSILTMKFSLDGQYLASAGEDGIVRVWQVVEDERSNEVDIPDIDPSCIYFTVNHLSELAPVIVEKEKMGVLKSLRKKTDSACVIFPPKVFRILEKPLHEFRGHSGEILDLSWSKNNYLLSSSVDKTVRLWRMGYDNCLEVFSHSNYVTCVQFNPVDDNHFISGSIDGKVRIWAITGCQVIDWTDIRDMVTAVCYRPDGQVGIVGSFTGNCRFYNLSDNHFQLESQICLHSKKKSPYKRITGFQFYPQDPSKLMITCADSQVRILHGINVIGKYRGLRNAGNQIFASFTSDGKHIISASEDSNVYIWNCMSQEETSLSKPKKVRSFEHFSANASVAIPWCGLESGKSENEGKFSILDEDSPNMLPVCSPSRFSLSEQFILESFNKGSATWPEEKLPTPRTVQSSLHKSQYKFLKACQSTSSSHAWGLVIVTGGWDGRIRSFHNYGLPVPL